MEELNFYHKLQRHVCRKYDIPQTDKNRIKFYIGTMNAQEFEHVTMGVVL